MDPQERSLEEQHADVEELAPWFHNLHLPGGLQTVPDHPLGDFPRFKWRLIAPTLPDNLDGAAALDIGCNAGFYSIELARRGAHVLAIDLDPHYLRQARWAARQFGVSDRIEFRQMQVYDLARLDVSFDIVWFMGVLYHLRYPLLALDIVAAKVQRLLVFQTLTIPGDEVYTDTYDHDIDEREVFLDPGWPKLAFIEHRFASDPTNWWVANHAAVEAMLRAAGFRITGRPGHEIYVCEPDRNRIRTSAAWEMEEYRAATGQSPERHAGARVRRGG
jgi:tRNA (mo5U34)-methyltransferase